MDDSSKEAAEQLASRVFTSDATLISSGGTFKGSTGKAQCSHETTTTNYGNGC
jgi:hypothetical protein